MAPFAVGFGLRTASGAVAGEPIERGIEAAGAELLFGFGFTAAFPPVAILGGVGHGLRARFGLLVGFGALAAFGVSF